MWKQRFLFVIVLCAGVLTAAATAILWKLTAIVRWVCPGGMAVTVILAGIWATREIMVGSTFER